MCGRYTLKETNPEKFTRKYGPFDGLEKPRYNRAPGQAHPVIIDRGNRYIWTSMQWGSNRSQKNPGGEFFPINARSETVTEKEIFSDSIRQRRCLIPADGWFEWQQVESQKYPFYHQLLKPDTFAIGGIWLDTGLDESFAFSILTRSASPEILHIHHRAPLIIPRELWASWMQPDINEPELQEIMKVKQPRINTFQVSSRVNSSRNEGPELLLPSSGKQALLF